MLIVFYVVFFYVLAVAIDIVFVSVRSVDACGVVFVVQVVVVNIFFFVVDVLVFILDVVVVIPDVLFVILDTVIDPILQILFPNGISICFLDEVALYRLYEVPRATL